MATIDLAEYKYKLSLDSSLYDSKMSQAGVQAETMQSKLSNVGSVMKTALVGGLVAVGVAVGTAFVKSIQSADELKKAMDGFSAQTGISGESADKFNESLKNIYSQNYGDSFEDIADSMALVVQNTNDLDSTQVENLTKNALALRDTFDYDVGESVRSASTLMEQFGISGDEAYNLIAQGAQNGLDFSGEMLDSVNEYSVQFAKVGLSADDMFNIMKNGSESGAFNMDKIGDAVKEFSIRAIDGSTTTIDGFSKLGMNADDMASKFAAGGDTAKQAFNETIQAIANMDDPVQQSIVGVDLFGTMWEDLGSEAVISLANTTGEIDKTKDAMGGINEIKYDSFGEAISGIGRQLQVGVMLPFGEKVLPILNKFANWFSDNLPQMISKAKTSFDKIATFIKPIIDTVKNVIFSFTEAKDGTDSTFSSIRETISSVITTVQDTIQAFITLFTIIWEKWGSDIVAFCTQYFTNIMNVIKNALAFVQSIIKTVTALISGDWKGFLEGLKSICSNGWKLIESIFKTYMDLLKGIVSAAFTVIKTVVTTIFDAIKAKAEEIWSSITSTITSGFNSVVSFMQQLPSKIEDQLNNVISKVSEWKTNFVKKAKEAGSDMVSGVIDKVKNLPSKIESTLENVIDKVSEWKDNLISKGTSAAKGLYDAIANGVSGLPKNLVSVGSNLVEGIWNGVNNKTQWIIDKIGGFTASVLAAIKKFFGIKSPSRLMRDEVGKYLAQGIGVGFEDEIDSVNKQITDSINTDFGINANVSAGISGSNILKSSQLSLDGTYRNGNSLSNMSNLSSLLSQLASKDSIQLTIGDVVVQGVQDVDGLSKAIVNQLPQAMFQQLHKRK